MSRTEMLFLVSVIGGEKNEEGRSRADRGDPKFLPRTTAEGRRIRTEQTGEFRVLVTRGGLLLSRTVEQARKPEMKTGLASEEEDTKRIFLDGMALDGIHERRSR